MLPKCELIEEYRPVDIYNLTMIKIQKGSFYDFVQTGVTMLLSQQNMSIKNNGSKLNTKESLLRLRDEGFIGIYEDAECVTSIEDIKPANSYFIVTTDKSSKSPVGGKELYAKIFHDDLRKIMSIDSNYRSNIFSVYHAIVGCVLYDRVDENGKIVLQQSDRMAYPSIDTIAERTSLNRKTVISCLKLLYESEVLYSLTVKVESNKDRNFYCRWMYKHLLKDWANTHLGRNYDEQLMLEGILE